MNKSAFICVHLRLNLFRALFLALALAYWAFSLYHLTIIPPVYEDEPWQASTGWKLARQGVFGSDMFAGFYGMERHYYAYMPVHPMLLGITFRFAGLGLFQDRFEPVALGLIVLALTYSLGHRLYGPAVGLLAAALLLVVRFTAPSPSQVSGIVLLDMARIARYDMAVPVFGLAALHAYLSGRRRPARPLWFALAGGLVALSSLSHLHGLFWAVALGVLAIWDRLPRRALFALGLGFAVPWLPYAAYVLTSLPDWRGQTREYAPRFDLLSPAWYAANLANEWRRYAPGLDSVRGLWLRPGWWATLIAWPVSLIALARRSAGRGDARLLWVPALIVPSGFALLIHLKLSNYLVAVVPLGALVVAWGAVELWQVSRQRSWRWLQAALMLVLAAVCVEGLSRVAAFESAARSTTPYAQFIDRVRAEIPPGSRVLGLHNFWLGLDDLDYRAWLVPLWQADPAHWSPPLSMAEALDGVAPDVILIDSRLRAFFEAASPTDARPREALAWIEQRGYRLAAVIEDPTYGQIEIFRRPDG